MRRIASFIAIILLLSSAAPLLACMTDAAMNQEESACCRSMHGNCGNMAKVGCCRTEVRTDEHPQLAAAEPTISFHFVVVDWFEPSMAEAQRELSSPLPIPEEHSPPGLVTALTTVLRI